MIYIGRWAFANSTCLEKITIPSSVRTIGYSAFAYWRETQTIYVPFKETEQPSGWDSQWKEYCSANIVYAQ